jgi:hypothetical protein
MCGQAVTCVDSQLYPTTCGPANCDEPIGPCGDAPSPSSTILTCDGGALVLEPDEAPDMFKATITDQGIVDYLVGESEKTFTDPASGYTVTQDFTYHVAVVDTADGRHLVVSELREADYFSGYITSEPGNKLESQGGGMRLELRGMQQPVYNAIVRYEIGNWVFQSCAPSP